MIKPRLFFIKQSVCSIRKSREGSKKKSKRKKNHLVLVSGSERQKKTPDHGPGLRLLTYSYYRQSVERTMLPIELSVLLSADDILR
jgi:hypothetical protein